MENSRRKFVLYTNPNNVTNRAYCADGAMEANEVLSEAKAFPGSYKILYKGMGNNEAIQKAQQSLHNYQF